MDEVLLSLDEASQASQTEEATLFASPLETEELCNENNDQSQRDENQRENAEEEEEDGMNGSVVLAAGEMTPTITDDEMSEI